MEALMVQAKVVSARQATAGRQLGFFHEIVKNRVLFLMVLPVLLYYFIFYYLPIGGIYLAFTRFNYDGGIFGSPFIGLTNFKFLLPNLYIITRNTILYNLAFIVIGSVCQIAAAIFISEIPGRIFKRTTQSMLFLPYFTSYVLVGAFVYNIFNYEFGTLNTILRQIHAAPVDVYSNTNVWKYLLVVFYIWKNIGVGTVIYLASLMNIDVQFYEAAKIDGASFFQQIRYITLPLLKPTFMILLLLSVSTIMKGQFDLFYQIIGNNSILFKTTDIIDTYVFRSLLMNFDIGMSSAAGLYQSFFGFLIILAVNFIARKVNEDYALF
jgi:putative aldouronate transport system permease protein